MRYCRNCGKVLDDKRASALYCGQGCKSKAYRKRNNIAEPGFLSRERRGETGRAYALLLPEEEQRIRTLEIEIVNYESILKPIEEQYRECHRQVSEYELAGNLPFKLDKTEVPHRPPLPKEPQKPRRKAERYPYDPEQKIANEEWYEQAIEKYRQEFQEYQTERDRIVNEYDALVRRIRQDPYLNKEEQIKQRLYAPYEAVKAKLQLVATEIAQRKNEIAGIVQGAAGRRQKEREKVSGMTGRALLDVEFETLPFEGKWKDLLGEPARRFYGFVWGDAKAGKSYLSFEFAQYLTQFGRVVYVATEEGISQTTKRKIQDTKAYDVVIIDSRDIAEIRKRIEKSDFVFIDSATKIDLTPEQLQEMRQENPDISFVVLLQSTKAGGFKGDKAWKHDVDFEIIVERIDEHTTKAICTGRFGNSELVYSYSPKTAGEGV